MFHDAINTAPSGTSGKFNLLADMLGEEASMALVFRE
jgi:hypothetical protein